MQVKWTLAVLALALAPPGARAAGKPVPPLIERAVQAWQTAFSAQDAAKIAAMFVEDGTFVNPMGARAEGRAAIEQQFTHDFQGPLRGATARTKIVQVRLLGPSYAFVELEQQVTGPNLPPGVPSPSVAHVAVVMKRLGPGWKMLDARPHFWTQRPGAHGAPGGDAEGPSGAAPGGSAPAGPGTAPAPEPAATPGGGTETK